MIDLDKVRSNFPSLSLKDDNENQIIYLDGPGGTQVPSSVIDAISNYYRQSNSNTHGEFITSKETDSIMDSMREKVAQFLGAESKECISIGQNMTTLNYSLSRGLSKIIKKGDEVIITELDHEANRGPWKTLESYGIKLVEVALLKDGTLDYNDFKNKINQRTALVAMGMSSNALGTINDFNFIKKITTKYNSLLLLDAVHYAPHFSIDVKSLDCDFLICSAYKFYGPHVGLLYSRPGLLDTLDPDRLIVQEQFAPYKIETGTLNHAACSGVSSAIDFISSIGEGNSYREKLVSAYKKISNHEYELASNLYSQLDLLDDVTIIGQDFSNKNRTPTVSFIHKKYSANEICKKLGKVNICAWDGHFYALKAIQKLNLEKTGGVTRLGVSLYNSQEEINRTVKVISSL
jgi:cysteine desulfurase family protein (TIGR01976 family)|tara:strand:+ start:2301 stop:3515 length:1215 start_codon:yes stop_codon:yes gene_type:complete